MATTQASGGRPENALVQSSIDAVIEREFGLIINHVRPDDDPSSLIAQPSIQEAMARLKSEISQLMRGLETAPNSTNTSTNPVHSNDEEGKELDRFLETDQAKAHQDNEHDSSPAEGNQDESHHTYEDLMVDDLPREPKPSLMMRKFMAHDAAEEEARADWDRRAAAIMQGEEEERQRKEWYFFYGSLMDPRQLQRVLGLKEPPRDFRSAEIVGYHVRMWGPYPVLLDGPSGNVVKGVAYEVEGAENKDMLATYETSNYREHKCIVQLSEGDSVVGTTFAWAGDVGELKDGSFDLKDWQMANLLDD